MDIFFEMRNQYDLHNIYTSIFATFIDTVAAIATALGVCIALKDSHEKHEENKREQASKIYTYIYEQFSSNDGSPQSRVKVVNHSCSRIYNVFVLDVYNKAGKGILETISTKQGSRHLSMVTPGEKKIEVTTGGYSAGGAAPATVIFFTDANNNGWFRGKDGVLKQVNGYEEEYINEKLGIYPPYI